MGILNLPQHMKCPQLFPKSLANEQCEDLRKLYKMKWSYKCGGDFPPQVIGLSILTTSERGLDEEVHDNKVGSQKERHMILRENL